MCQQFDMRQFMHGFLMVNCEKMRQRKTNVGADEKHDLTK